MLNMLRKKILSFRGVFFAEESPILLTVNPREIPRHEARPGITIC